VGEELYKESVEWAEGTGMELSKVLLCTDSAVQIRTATLPIQACLFSLPWKFHSKQLDLYLLQHVLETFHGKLLAAGAN
jgi:hypothetical protein